MSLAQVTQLAQGRVKWKPNSSDVKICAHDHWTLSRVPQGKDEGSQCRGINLKDNRTWCDFLLQDQIMGQLKTNSWKLRN